MKNGYNLHAVLVVFAFSCVSMTLGENDYSLVKKAGEITRVFGEKGEAVLFESEDSRAAIEWTLASKPIAVVGKGSNSLSAHIAIPRDHVSLIITEGAEFVTRNDAAFKAWITEFEEENLLENLPTVTVKVKRTGEFKDRPAEEVLNKTYTFDLSAH